MTKIKDARSPNSHDRDWTPVRRGPLYCSPACGGRCTVREHQRAVRDADELVRKLRGTGWRPVVWENLGWHHRAVSGTVQVCGDRYGARGSLRYGCLISDDPDSLDSPAGGSVLWSTADRSFRDPNQAVEHELRSAEAVLGKISGAVRSARRAAGRAP